MNFEFLPVQEPKSDVKENETSLYKELERIRNELQKLNSDIIFDIYGDEIHKDAENILYKII